MRVEIEQNTDEWLALRLGKITGSEVKDLMVKGRKKEDIFGVGAKTYIDTKITELLTGTIKEEFSNKACDWGKEYEPDAREDYELETLTKVTNGGFYVQGDYVGCSPDGIVGDDGIIEIKCPYNSVNHYKTLVSKQVPREYLYQVLHNTLIVGAEWCDFISYDPRFINPKNRLVILRVNLSDHAEEVANLQERTELAVEIIKSTVEKLK